MRLKLLLLMLTRSIPECERQFLVQKAGVSSDDSGP
jgi:hypothetical protein